MKRNGNCLIGLLGGLMFCSPASAASDPAGNPYETIADRNVFRLREPPKPQETTEIQKPPPPKITLQGLTTILGRRQVLFKVAMPAKPPEPAKEVGLVLSEGERQSEIEVVEINEVAGTIVFNNNGTPQTLSMEKDAAKPPAGAAPPVGAPPPMAGGVPPPAAMPAPMPTPAIAAPSGGSSVTTIGGAGAGSKNMPNRTLRLPTTQGGLPTLGGMAQHQSAGANPPVDLETAELVTDLQHLNAVNKNDPMANMFPPTRSNPTRNVVTPPPPPQ